MSIIPWVGARRVAIVPVIDLQVDQEPPPDWSTRFIAASSMILNRGQAWISRSSTTFRRTPTAGPSLRVRSSRWCGRQTPR